MEGKKLRHGNNLNMHQYMNDEDVVHIFNRTLLIHIKNEIMLCVATWMDLEIIILNEVRKTPKNLHNMILLIHGI